MSVQSPPINDPVRPWEYFMVELQARTFAKVARAALFTSGSAQWAPRSDRDTSMGKSDKKVRAESINKLRKQYDAFLEEDRKRKERNEDILSKLDKMRSTVTRYKANIYNDQRSPIPPSSEVPTNIVRYNEPQVPMQLDIRSKHADETYLLREISKKYILIPKTRSIIDNDYIPRAIKQDNNNDSDWKSKYSILDKLKQTEKEVENNASIVGNVTYDDLSTELLMHRKDGEQTDNAEIPVKEPKNIDANEFTPHAAHGLREYQGDESVIAHNYDNDRKEETTVPEDKSGYETNLPGNFDDAYNINSYKNENSADTNNLYRQLESNSDDDTKIVPRNTNLAADKVPEQNEPIPQKNVYDRQNIRENDSKYELEDTEKQRPELLLADRKTKVAPPVELAQKSSDDSSNVNYPIDVINVQDFTPNDDVTLVDGVNINPDCHDANAGYYASSYQHTPEAICATQQDKNITDQHPATSTENVGPENITPGEVYSEPTQQYYPERQNIGEVYNEPTQQYVNPEEQNTGELYNQDIQPYNTTTVSGMENVLGIQAFEAEQNEMFYSEQQDQNYAQYNQGDAYNVGYTGSTEGYDPAAYYESAQQEAYPVEVNEHEETSQRYDPSYEQQYVAPVAEDWQYTEQSEYQQQAPNEQDVLEPTFMEYDPTQYAEQLSVVDQVEQQLDDEAGYCVQGAAEDAAPGADGSAPHQPTPDQTLTQTAAVAAPEKET